MFLQRFLFVAALSLVTGFEIQYTRKSCSKLPNGKFTYVDCTKSLTCTKGVGTLETCTDSKTRKGFFSLASGRCMTAAFSSCADVKKYCPSLPNARPPPIGGNTTQPDLGFKFKKNQSSVLESLIHDDNFTCSEGDGYFSVKNDRASYRICRDGESYMGKCEENAIFDSQQARCVAQRNFELMPIIIPGMATEVGANCNNRGDGKHAYKPDKRVFQLCCGSQSTMYKCPYGKEYDATTFSCVPVK